MTAAAMPIAIVGMACRLPGAADPDAFWELLAAGSDAVTTVPADRFAQAPLLHPRIGEPGRTYTFAAGTLGDIQGFDAAAFGLSPREAAEMDPQQRLLLELAHEALEDAGLPPSRLAGGGTGVFVGASLTDHANLRQADPASGDRYFMTGGALSVLANRIGHVFDLRGGAETIDTACSSGLVALHRAAAALAAGALPAAIVGGVNLLLSPFPFVGFARAGMLSPRGRCHAFDARADGYVRAEGGVVLVLKRLADARVDGDAVRAVLLGTGVNAAGRTLGLSLPSGAAQQALLAQVLAAAGIDPDRLGYFEAHGTGTAAGDPIEATALGAAIGQRRRRPLPIGSAKTNIGHTEAASGLVGVLKAVLMLERRLVPPSLHCATPNPAIDFSALRLRVATTTERLGASAAIGVNSFGFGGTNACAVLASPPAPRRATAATRRATPADATALPPLLLSARSPGAVRRLAAHWRDRLPAVPRAALPALLRGAARHRDLHPFRISARGDAPAALSTALATPGAIAAAGRGAGVAFVFSGNGAQQVGMARAALAASAAFRDGVAAADALLLPLLGWSPAAVLAAGADADDVAATERAQPLLFTVQAGIVAALAAHGIRPAWCLGHSVGEVAAAAASGLLEPAAAARLIVARSRAQALTRGAGGMAALALGPEAAGALLAECGPGLEIAAINAPAAVTVAGPEPALTRLLELARSRRHGCVRLDLDHAFHSAAMDPARAPLLLSLGNLTTRPPNLPLISTVTGTELTAADAEYWWRNLREPVRLADAVRAVAARGPALLLEIGPHPILQNYLRETLAEAGSDAAVLGTLIARDGARDGGRDAGGDPFPAIADQAFRAGADPRSGPAFAGVAVSRSLPKTPFDRVPTGVAPTIEALALLPPPPEHPLLGSRRLAGPGLWARLFDTTLDPWLGDHAFNGRAVLPAAAMLEMALAAGVAWHPDAAALEVAGLTIHRPLWLAADAACEVETRLDAAGGFELLARQRLVAAAWTLHASGRVAALPRLPAVREAVPTAAGAYHLDGGELRRRAATCGLTYGAAFAAVWDATADPAAGIATVRLALPDAAPPDAGFLLHPARLDGALQALFALLGDGDGASDHSWLPVRIARLVVARQAAPVVTASVRLRQRGVSGVGADVALRDADGRVVGTAEGVWLQRVPPAARGAADEKLFHVALCPAPDAAAQPPASLPAAIAAASRHAATRAPRDTAALLEGYCAAAALAALQDGAPPGPWAAALLGHLRSIGLAGPGPAGLAPVAAADLPPAPAIWRQALLDQPDAAAELAWAAAAAERLRDPTAAPTASPPFGDGWRAAGDALLAAVAAFAAEWPAGRLLRVLDAGFGHAPLAARLGALLAGQACPVRLLTTASGGAPGGAASADAGRQRAGEWDPFGAAVPPPVDLIVGLGVAARSQAGTAVLPALRPALAAGGALLLAEPAPGLFWDFCAGQDPEWWAQPAGALAAAGAWEAALASPGWSAAQVTPLPGGAWPALLIAATRAGTAAAPPHFGSCTVFAADDARDLAAALVAAFASRGVVALVERLAGAPATRLLRDRPVLVLPGADPGALPATLAATGRLAAAAAGAARGFWIITRGGRQPEGGAHVPAAAALFALGRVLANEHPDLAPRRLDVCPTLTPTAAAARLLPELLGETDGEPEVTLTGGSRMVPRVRAGLPPPPPRGGPAIVTQSRQGHLASLAWAARSPPEPAAGDVRLRVLATGLNFRDLMWAQGMLPEPLLVHGFAGPGLGMECAGVVEAVGEGVAWRPGDTVFGVAPAALATHVVTRADAVVAVPPGLDPVAAAALPVACLTALHALEEVARLAAGERVLLHGAAGAVGLVALQVALAAGARVAATAGTPARRAFLRMAGAEIVLDSRDPGFADALRAAWPDRDGAVDVVLNSLAGDAMERSLGLLRPFGRFLELGKRDFATGHRVALTPLRRNASFHAIDIDALPRERPAQAAALLREVAARLADGRLRALPTTAFPAAAVEGALRALQGAAQIGKLVVTPPPSGPAIPAAADPLPASLAGTIVVVGGTAGFGLQTALWLAERGAAHLALVSRRGAVPPAALLALGQRVSVHACDATDADSLAAALAAIRVATGPITGIVHAAAVRADGIAAMLDPQRVASVLAAKMTIAEHLDRLTETDRPALFLLFGSAATAIGNPGQAAYVAANAALEALARRRRAAGRPALTVAWGPIADAGMLAADATTVAGLERRLAATPLAAASALAELPALFAAPAGEFGVAALDWRAATVLPVLREPGFAGLVIRAETTDAAGDLRATLRDAPAAAALPLLRDALAAVVGGILRLPPERIAADAPLAGLGLDSLGAIELRTAIDALLGVSAPFETLPETLTLDRLSRLLLPSLPSAHPPAPAMQIAAPAAAPPLGEAA